MPWAVAWLTELPVRSRDPHRGAGVDAASRAVYSARQLELVRALVSDGHLPSGFDADRAALLANSLVRKRGRAVARSLPALARCLGPSYQGQFGSFATRTPLRVPYALADAFAFASWLGMRDLDEAACREVLSARLQFIVSRRRLRRRLLPSVRCALVRDGALVLGVRLPLLGTRIACLQISARPGSSSESRMRPKAVERAGEP